MIRLHRLTVEGGSMRPGFAPGDRLLAVSPWPLRTGQVVAALDPRTGRLLVKRVAAVSDGLVDLRGDSSAASTDSRHFGAVPRRLIVGRVIYRYHPPSRSGWWP